MNDITQLDTITTLDIDPDQVLQQAVGKLKSVLVLGFDETGNIYAASSTSDTGHCLLLMELGNLEIMKAIAG